MVLLIVFWMTIVLLCLAVMMIIWMYRTAKLERILYQDLYFDDLPTSFGNSSFFFISDLHQRVVSDRLIDTVRMKADYVIIGGDLTEGSVPISRVEQNIVQLKKIGPMYFVWGNNDYDVDYRKLKSMLLQHGVTILANTAVNLKSNKGEKITVLGIDDISMGRDRLDLALAKCGHEKTFRILLSHNPIVKDQLLEEHSIRLVLSGHTHGGQIRLFGYGLYKLGGIDFVQNCMFVISNGYGTSTVPLRLSAKPETHVFTLKRGHHTAIGKKKEIQL